MNEKDLEREVSFSGNAGYTLKRYRGISLAATALTLAVVAACGPEYETCSPLPEGKRSECFEYTITRERLPNGDLVEKTRMGNYKCSSEQECSCLKDIEESNDACECTCKVKSKPREPVDKW